MDFKLSKKSIFTIFVSLAAEIQVRIGLKANENYNRTQLFLSVSINTILHEELQQLAGTDLCNLSTNICTNTNY